MKDVSKNRRRTVMLPSARCGLGAEVLGRRIGIPESQIVSEPLPSVVEPSDAPLNLALRYYTTD